MKIRHKIILLFTVLVTAIIILLGFYVYYSSSRERKIVFHKRLKSRANYSAQLYSFLKDSSNLILHRIDSASGTGLLPQRSIGIFDIDGKSLYKFDKQDTQRISIDKVTLGEVITKNEKYFAVEHREAIALKYRGNNKEFIVVVAAFDEDGIYRLNELGKILLISLAVGIIFAALTGFLFSKQLVKPISQIIYEVNEISSLNLNYRIKAGKGRDELNQLANTFNQLLGRLQKSFNIQRSFISNASHELSTPLTSISSQLEVTLQRERIASEYREVLVSINEDVLQMRQLTKSLLEIAKVDSEGNIELKEVRIDEVLLKITSEVQKISSNYKVDLFFGEFPDDEKDFVVFGNIELLHSAIKNLVENGCKYSSDNTSRVDLSYSNNHVYVQVKNRGNVIAIEEFQKIFQPFYRGNNTKEYKGFGLGLALAKGIARLHKGSIEVQSDENDGTIFTINIPSLKTFH
jgi:two-component system, OmpR family, sensor histidine kinase ArlS